MHKSVSPDKKASFKRWAIARNKFFISFSFGVKPNTISTKNSRERKMEQEGQDGEEEKM